MLIPFKCVHVSSDEMLLHISFNCAYQSAVPHAMILFVGEDSSTVAVVAEQLAVFRILRALKMVAGLFVW